MEDFPDLFGYASNTYDSKDFAYLEGTVFDPALDLLTPPLSPEVCRVTPCQKANLTDYDALIVKSEWDQMLPSDGFKSDNGEEDLFTYPLVDPSTMLPPECKVRRKSVSRVLKDSDVMWSEYDSDDVNENANLSLEHVHFPIDLTNDLSNLSEDKSDSDSSLPGALSDHSYFCTRKIKSTYRYTPVLTPAESEEEEIDVVTVEKIPTSIKFHLRPSTCITSQKNGTVSSVSPSKTPEHLAHQSSKRPFSSHFNTNSSKRLKAHHSESKFEVNVCNLKLSHCSKSKHKNTNEIVYLYEPDKRSQHNDLERRRRNDMKSSFHTLRGHIPNLQNQQRAPKLIILNEAKNYIAELVQQERELQKKLKEDREKRDQLMKTLTRLQKNCKK